MNEQTNRKEIYSVYSREGDMTFIMEGVYDGDGEPLSTECVGWYHGEPDDESTAFFVGKLKAEYLMGRDKDEPREGSEAAEEKKNTYVVVFEYQDGRGGVCIESGKPLEFATEKQAADYAEELNGLIDDDMKLFFPFYRAKKAGEGTGC